MSKFLTIGIFPLKFVGTLESSLLEHCILKLQRFLSAEDHDIKEEQYVNRLACSQRYNGVETKLSLDEAVLCSISIWCDSRLEDYHLHFSKVKSCLSLIIC